MLKWVNAKLLDESQITFVLLLKKQQNHTIPSYEKL